MIWMNSMRYIKLLSIFAVFFYFFQANAAENVTITMEVNNIPSSKGNIIMYFSQNEDEFKSERQTQYSFFFPAKKDRVTAKIIIPKGIYGIHIYHDENDNKMIDKNSSNHPVEKFGFSNNYFGSYSKLPDFNNTLINIEKNDQFIKINLR